jgi:hypothetical protein
MMSGQKSPWERLSSRDKNGQQYVWSFGWKTSSTMKLSDSAVYTAFQK